MATNYAVGMVNNDMAFYGDRLIILDDLDKATAKSIARAKNKMNTNYTYFMVDWTQESQESDEAFGRLVMAE